MSEELCDECRTCNRRLCYGRCGGGCEGFIPIGGPEPVKLRPALLRFAEAMELKLRRRDVSSGHDDSGPPKVPWETVPARILINGVVNECSEMLDAALEGDTEGIRAESVDVAAQAMTVYCNLDDEMSGYLRGWPKGEG